ncbi:MAG TPA: FAD-dependent oxidoreductase, partial [Chitinophagaceae bacterium]|nr:FAD-dependent oxidoreductase [Chitinophagaceae bacterium]
GFEKVEVESTTSAFFTGTKLITTIPVSLLQQPQTAAAITFKPNLPEYEAAFQKLGHGNVIKLLLEFKSAFWKEQFHLSGLGFLFSDEAIPTWWTQHPQPSPLLVGWCAGPHATALKDKSDAEILKIASQSLAHIFNLSLTELESNLNCGKVCNWAADPYTSGGYSYITTTTKEAFTVLAQPVKNTLFFAGEGLYNHINIGTVEAALQSGRQVAHQLLSTLAL